MKRILIFLFVTVYSALQVWGADEKQQGSCIACHTDRQKMTALGFPNFTLDEKQVSKETKMPAPCTGCHLGNSQSPEKDGAHKGLRRVIAVKKQGLVGVQEERKLPLQVTQKKGSPLITVALPIKRNEEVIPDPTVNLLLYLDKRLDTLSQDYPTIASTCGNCHPKETEQFPKSAMGRNAKQSRYSHWSNSGTGPHNCGTWFDGNYEKIASETAVPFQKATSDLNQRSCNTCHVGCLDCHYSPEPAVGTDIKGHHFFRRSPPPQNCYGGGRGVICHAGPEERRRGAGYFGGSYSFPEGAAPDVHFTKGIGCLQCHDNSGTNGKLGHGVIKRQANCKGCHGAIVESNARSVHRKLSCEACHIRDVGGYQATFWGPGKLAGTATPFVKFKDYYGIMRDPILIRDQKGRWIPVKPYPMAVMNQKKGPDLKPGLYWRYPNTLPDLSRTDDAWGYVGIADGLPENNKALLWIQMDKVSHKYGKARECDSCHGSESGEQRQEVSWDYGDVGATPFSGKHTVVAGKKGLAIKEMVATDRIEPSEGYTVSAFAPWAYLRDRWEIQGDFSLPVVKNKENYSKLKQNLESARKIGVLHR